MRSNNHLLETDEKARSEICSLFLNSGPNDDNHLFTEENLDSVALAAPLQKIRCETCNKEFSEEVYENHLRSQIINNNLNRGDVQWIRCGVCNVKVRSTFWDKHLGSKSRRIEQGGLSVQEERNVVPSFRELVVSNFKKNNVPARGNETSISPYYLGGGFNNL